MTLSEPGLRPPRVEMPRDPSGAVDVFLERVPNTTLHLGTGHDRARLRFWLVTFLESYNAALRRRPKGRDA